MTFSLIKTSRRYAFKMFFSTFVGLTAAVSAWATAAIDTTFGTNGRVTISQGESQRVSAITLQTDDKIIVVGDIQINAQRDGFVVRYNANGTLDTSFGNGGQVVFPASANTDSFNGTAVQADGKIVVVGNYSPIPNSSATDFLILRLNPNGSLDNSFGNGGIVTINQSSQDTLRAVKIQPDGKIVAVGGTSDESGRGAVIRLNQDGSFDTSFGGGMVLVNHPNSFLTNEFFTSLDFYPNNRILLGGTVRSGTGPGSSIGLLTLLEPNGALVQDFASSGFSTNFGLSLNFAPEVKVLPNGKFVVGALIAGVYRSDGFPEEGLSPAYEVGGFALLSNGNLAIAYQGYVAGLRGTRILNKNLQLVGSDENDLTTGNQIYGSDIAVQSDDKIIILRTFDYYNPTLVRLNGITSNATRVIQFDEDRKTDIAVYRPSNYTLYGLRSTVFQIFPQFFAITAPPSQQRQIIAENYLTTGLPPNNVPQSEFGWFNYSTNNSPAVFGIGAQATFQFGALGDVPVGGDYDGDNFTDYAVFRPSNGTWYISQSSDNQVRAFTFGQAGDKLVPADYDYDGITDFAVFRPSNGAWYVSRSSDGGIVAVQFGQNGDVPITGDFDGDGRADFTVFRPSNGYWYSLKSREGFSADAFGIATDIPVPGDYDGDGRHDIAVFRAGIWYILGSRDGFRAVQWGLPDDIPISVRY